MNENKNIFGETIEDEVKNIFGDNAEPASTIVEPQKTVEQPKIEPGPIAVEEKPVTPSEPSNTIEINTQNPMQAPINQPEKTTVDPLAENEGTAGPLLVAAFINAIAIFGIIYGYLNYNYLLIIALPGIFVFLSLIFAIKEKKKSSYPQGVLVGGILSAVVSFVLSVINTEQSDLYMYYAIASVAAGVIGIILSSIITNILTDFKNQGALKIIGYLIVLAGLFAGPYYLYTKYPEEVFKYVFLEQIEVKAETEDEYIVKTLKNRYGESFTCDNTRIQHALDQRKQRMTIRTCTSENGIKTTVQSVEYEPSLVQYTIIEDYLDQRYFNQLKTDLETRITQASIAQSATVSIYSKENCNLIADCVDCEEYLANKNELNDRVNMYETSTKLNYQKDLTVSSIDFVNNGEYKYIITVNGYFAGYQVTAYDDIVNKVLIALNGSGLQNNYGYEIILKSSQSLGGTDSYNTEVYKVKGTASDDKTFKNPTVVE